MDQKHFKIAFPNKTQELVYQQSKIIIYHNQHNKKQRNLPCINSSSSHSRPLTSHSHMSRNCKRYCQLTQAERQFSFKPQNFTNYQLKKKQNNTNIQQPQIKQNQINKENVQYIQQQDLRYDISRKKIPSCRTVLEVKENKRKKQKHEKTKTYNGKTIALLQKKAMINSEFQLNSFSNLSNTQLSHDEAKDQLLAERKFNNLFNRIVNLQQPRNLKTIIDQQTSLLILPKNNNRAHTQTVRKSFLQQQLSKIKQQLTNNLSKQKMQLKKPLNHQPFIHTSNSYYSGIKKLCDYSFYGNKSISRYIQRAPILKYMDECQSLKQLYAQFINEEQFVDDSFPIDKIQFNDIKQVIWIEILPQYGKKLFPDNFLSQVSGNFIKSTTLELIPIIKMLNIIIAINPNIIKNLFEPTQIGQLYSCWLFQTDQFKPLFVDRFMPFDTNKNPLYGWVDNSIWTSVLLKCLAKVKGSYQQIQLMCPWQLYKSLTGIQAKKLQKNQSTKLKQLKQIINAHIKKGYVPIYCRDNQYSIIKKINLNKIHLITPLKRDKTILADELLNLNSEIYYIRQQSNLFINTKKFSVYKQSLFSFELHCPKNSKIHFNSSPIVKKILIYELNGNAKVMKMNLKCTGQNYMESQLRRGDYKVILQCGNKPISLYFKQRFSYDKLQQQFLSDCYMTTISDQQVILVNGQQIKGSGQQSAQDNFSFYRVPHKQKQEESGNFKYEYEQYN